MLKRVLLTGPLVFAFVLAFALPVHADPISYYAIMIGANEVPPVGTSASGLSLITLNGNLLTINVSFSGLTGGPASAAHIHCCVPPGSNAGVAVPFTGFPAATSGTYTNTVDLTLLSTYTAAFVTANGGTAAGAEAALIAGLNSLNAYSNIHDATFPGGEIRGWITPTPEPGTLLLLGTGLAAVAGTMRRRLRG